MLCTYLRSSGYNQYSMCQHKFYMIYVLGIKDDSGLSAEKGTISHKVFESLAACQKKVQNSKYKNFSIDDDALGKIKFTRDTLNSKEFVDEIIRKSFDFYSKRSKHAYAMADFKFCEATVWKALNYNNGEVDPRNRVIVEPEQAFEMVIDEEWARYSYEMPNGEILEGQLAIKGTIDLITKVDDSTLEVVDWKSGRYRKCWIKNKDKEYDDFLHDPQLLLYYYACSKLYPDKDVIMSIYYINAGGMYTLCYDENSKKEFMGMLKERFLEIKNNKNPKLLDYNQRDFRCTRLCNFYKQNWPGTDQNMCSYVHDNLRTYGIEGTTKNLTAEGFTIDKYSNPGE